MTSAYLLRRPDPAPDNLYEQDWLKEQGRRQCIAVASSFITMIDLRDRYTGGHSTRVATYAHNIAMRMALDEEEVETVVTAASLHDVGKIGVSDLVLLKEGRLTDAEFGEIKKHPEYGWMVLKDIDGLKEASLIVLHHHERWDGCGYPGKLGGEAIPVGSRIIAVADSYDAMTTNRPYRKAMPSEEALAEIQRCAGTQFDVDAVAAFVDYMKHARTKIVHL